MVSESVKARNKKGDTTFIQQRILFAQNWKKSMKVCAKGSGVFSLWCYGKGYTRGIKFGTKMISQVSSFWICSQLLIAT